MKKLKKDFKITHNHTFKNQNQPKWIPYSNFKKEKVAQSARKLENIIAMIVIYPLTMINLKSLKFRHPKEKISKSSIVPSKIISPNQVEIRHDYDIPQIREPDQDYDSVVLLFPSEDAKDINQMSIEELNKIQKVILIDCTWNQTKHFLKQQPIQELKKVKIQTEKTVFWRYQQVAETNLSTIEALYFFFRDYDVTKNCKGDYQLYDGKYDNILYYYAMNYHLIQHSYTEGDKKDYNFLRIPGYIQGKRDHHKVNE